MTILTYIFCQIFSISRTKGKEFRKYWPQGFESEVESNQISGGGQGC